MDVIKVLLLVCVALVLLFLGGLCAVGMWNFNAGAPANEPVPTAVLVFQGICGFFALAFGLSSAWVLRIAWRVARTRPPVVDGTDGSSVAVPLNQIRVTGEYQDFSLGRLTGAGWLLAILSVAIPLVAAGYAPRFFAAGSLLEDLMGIIVAGSIVVFFFAGFWSLHLVGVRLLNPPAQRSAVGQKFAPISADDIPDPRRNRSPKN